MKEKSKLPRSLPQRSAPFSFKVKSLLLEMVGATTDVEECLEALTQDRSLIRTQQGMQSTQKILEIRAERFHSVSRLNLPVLCWMEAALELTEREEHAILALRNRIGDLADKLSQNPLKHQQKNSEKAFLFIGRVAHNLEILKHSLQLERKAALENAALEERESEKEKHQQWVRDIQGNVISGAIGSVLTLIVGILVKFL